MSASRDTSQRIGFSTTNYYALYKNRPPEQAEQKPLDALKSDLGKLNDLHQELKDAIADLEAILKGK